MRTLNPNCKILIYAILIILIQFIGQLTVSQYIPHNNDIKVIILQSMIWSILPAYFLILVFKDIQKQVKDSQAELIQTRQLEAIAKIAKKISHDIKKPFTLVHCLSKILDHTENDLIKPTMKKFIPEISQAINQAGSYISLLSEDKYKQELCLKEESLYQVIEYSFDPLINLKNKDAIQVKYEYHHQHMVIIDKEKVVSSFTQILEYILSEKSSTTSLTIQTWEHGNSISIHIIKKGESFRSDQDKSLFTPFDDECYSYNKEKIGLAIAKEVTAKHSIQLDCQTEENQIIFKMSFSKQHTSKNVDNKLIYLDDRPNSMINTLNQSAQLMQRKLEDELKGIILDKNIAIEIGIVDDEIIYQDYLENLIDSMPELKSYLSLQKMTSYENAMKLIPRDNLDVVFMDIDLGSNELNGISIIEKMSIREHKPCFIVHSSRTFDKSDLEEKSLSSMVCVSKPLSKTNLLEILVQVALKKEPYKAMDNQTKSKHIIILDDSIFMLEQWKLLISGFKQLHFLSPELFFAAVEKDPDILANAQCIISDFYFDLESSQYNGLSFAKELKKGGIDIPMFLSSDAYLDKSDVHPIFDLHVNKDVLSAWDQIKSHLQLKLV